MGKKTKDLEFLIRQNLNNLADIPDNEDLIVKFLLHRYEQGRVYTWAGPVLLAINPRHLNSELYDHTNWNYSKKLATSVPCHAMIEPHVFAVAEEAHYRLAHGLGKGHQVIVISGDSGSGKTFSASKILCFLAAKNQSLSIRDKRCDKVSSTTILKIEKACLIISAFSTATTERNKHSSRHGQLVQLQYQHRSMRGAIINSFLLEQSRVTSGCNNFHIFYQVQEDIFYQILAGSSESELDAMKLSRSTFYKIMNSARNFTQEESITGFEHTVEAMNGLGLGEEQRKEVFKVIALLIHLGNIQFKEDIAGGCDIDTCKKDSVEALERACELMLLPTPDLVKLLTTNLISPRSSTQRHSMYYSAITTVKACNSRLHSIVRHLYYRLFNWLVNRLNKILTSREENPKLLGILDIFGFESFSDNSIEQLSINYANEKMQLHFMNKYLDACRSELEGEGLSVLPPSHTSWIYEQRLAAIEGHLFPVLNDACLVARIDNHTSANDLLISTRHENEGFVYNRGEKLAVSHYSRIVEYTTADILRKNTDKVPAELLSVLACCKNKFVLSLLGDNDEVNRVELQDRPRIDKKKNTALAKLKQSMDALMKELDKYDLHYIRCMKPVKHADDREMIKEFKQQLASSGILDALPLNRCSLPIRLRYEEFSKRYSKRNEIGDPMHTCKVILRQALNKEELQCLVHFGSRLIFLTEAVLFKLELKRNEFRSQCASKIQYAWYKYKIKKRFELSKSLSSRVGLEDNKAAQETTQKICKGTLNVYNECDSAVSITRCTEQGMSTSYRGKNSRFRPPPDQRSSDKTLLWMRGNEDCNILSSFSVYLNNQVFFYRKGMLSRRRLPDVPVRFHTRLTCLPDSHRLPRSELPGGLKDCL